MVDAGGESDKRSGFSESWWVMAIGGYLGGFVWSFALATCGCRRCVNVMRGVEFRSASAMSERLLRSGWGSSRESRLPELQQCSEKRPFRADQYIASIPHSVSPRRKHRVQEIEQSAFEEDSDNSLVEGHQGYGWTRCPGCHWGYSRHILVKASI